MENFIKILIPLLPTIILIIGGQALIDKYSVKRKKKESEIELLKKTREEKYFIIKELYILFGEFMKLYRIINSSLTDLSVESVQIDLLNRIVDAESKIESIVLKIGCEFISDIDDNTEIENMLGNLRQSVQIWRQNVTSKQKLPFTSSSQDDYMRFKIAFTYTASFMIDKIYDEFEISHVSKQKVSGILIGSFDNRHEKLN